MKTLVLVESPTKAKTLEKYLGDKYQVRASVGHVRDLAKSNLSVETERVEKKWRFKPIYKVVEGKEKTVKELQQLAKKAKEVVLAMDPDREGEAIAWHIATLLSSKSKSKKYIRVVFHQITKKAVLEAMEKPGKLNTKLINAQQARRILDRLVGYKLSPVLWKKVRRGLSAGRVQSVVVRLIVEKEEEREKFKPEEYWLIEALLKTADKKEISFKLVEEVENKKRADKVLKDLKKAKYLVDKIKAREVSKKPWVPFTTSTLQQASANIMGWSGKKTMSVAQRLYEEGLITYHRTDSLYLAGEAVTKVRKYIETEWGKEYLPDKPRFYKTKSKSAQEAHEAIRPTRLKSFKAEKIGKDFARLYRLIWSRFVGCQMIEARVKRTKVTVKADGHYLEARGEVIVFDGWMKAMDKRKFGDDQQLPEMTEGDKLVLVKLLGEQKFTLPPARYSDASLIKTLEKLGIGRPSTYAPIISTIQSRGYVEKEERQFKPTVVGEAVVKFLGKYFEEVMDYGFTAEMEDDLDKIAHGKKKWQMVLGEFWGSFIRKVEKVEKTAERVKIETEKTGKKCPECKKGAEVIRVGRFGKFLSCSTFPKCRYTAKYLDKVGKKCPECKKGDIIVKKTKKGRQFFGCSQYPECDWASWRKPK